MIELRGKCRRELLIDFGRHILHPNRGVPRKIFGGGADGARIDIQGI